MCRGAGGAVGAARADSAAAASVASRYALGADGVGAARPGARGSQVAASRYALGAEAGGCASERPHVCSPPITCARCLLGVVGMTTMSCAACCSRGSMQRALRAPAEGEGGVARHGDLTAAASATLQRSAGTVAHGKRAARERRRRRAKGLAPPACRPRAAGAPREARARAARVQTAGENLFLA